MIKNSALMIVALMCLAASPREHIPAQSARNFIGYDKTVCGVVTEVANKPYGSFVNMGNHYIKTSTGKPLLVPDFTVVLWKSYRDRLEIDPTTEFAGKEVCVTGRIEGYRWRRTWHHFTIPQIEIRSLDQYMVDGEEND